MDKCCWDIIKFFVFITNLAAFIVCSCLTGLGIYVLQRAEDVLGYPVEKDLSSDNTTAIHFSFILIFIVVFGFLTIFTFLGCCGASCQNRCMLGSFIIILFVFCGAYIGAIVYLFVKFPNEVEMVASELEKTIPYYKSDDTESLVRKFWDWIQPTLQCCGVSNWHDWKLADSGLKQGRQVPASCCKGDAVNDCVYHPDSENAFAVGCLEKVALPLRIIFWGLPAAMGLILIGSLILCSRCGRGGSDSEVYEDTRPHRRKQNRLSTSTDSYSQDAGYVYRQTPTPVYPSAPPYNPDYADDDRRGPDALYPLGVIPPYPSDYRQPLMLPPSYQDVVRS